MRTALLLAALALLLAGCVEPDWNYTLPLNDSAANQTGPASVVAPNATALPIVNATAPPAAGVAVRTIAAGAIPLAPKSYGRCQALAPADWTMFSNAQGNGADVVPADNSMHAGWGITSVYTFLYPTVDDFIAAIMPALNYPDAVFAAAKDQGDGYYSREFTSGDTHGIMLYKVFPGDATFYIVTLRYAAAKDWAEDGALASSVALSIRCSTQASLPSSGGSDGGGSDGGTATGSTEGGVSLEDKWQEAIMGFENVYSPTTGEHWQAPLNAYDETGPDGPGYYRAIPNGYEKLEPGYGDY